MSADGLHHDWLSLIEISGPFLAVPVLKEAFPQGLEELDSLTRKRLRQAYEEWREASETDDPQLPELHTAWVDEVLSRGLDLDGDGRASVLKRADWCIANLRVSLPEHALALSPDLAVVDEQRANKPLMLIHTYSQDTDLDATQKLDGWAATPAERMVQLCRATGCRLALVTNGERWMLIDAPEGAVTTFASWYARIWAQEPITLQAFVHLLGIRRFFVDEAEQLPALFDRSLKYQDEVTEALGEQVRRAVEVLIQALDKADQDRDRELLREVKEPELYEAALTLMMRLVFLLAAEERGLLLLGDERYEANYAISTLRMQLRTESEEILERRWDAWSRLLATFRAVFGGIEHENLRLPALGGSLFDPDRFPFLEGRAKGSNWRTEPARPLPIDNRTVLLLLEAIQQFQGRTLSYRALDVEQVGYVYEGLLERTVKRTAEVTLELDGTKNAKAPWIKLAELETAGLEGSARLAELLQDRSGSSASRIRNDLARPVDDTLADRLLATCHGDTALRDRIKRYAHLVRSDPWGYPLVYPAGAFIVTTGSDRRETGTHYTPKSLTEVVVVEALTPIAYVGPSDGKPREQWVLRSPSELLELKICDPAMGSGAFLVQACRWLADRLVEAWSQAEGSGKTVSADGEVLDAPYSQEPLPHATEARAVIARRLIAERCLYGVDLNPLAVELAKLSIWLVTLAKGRPFGFLDHNLRCGDSLLGIHRLDQLTELSMAPTGKGQQRLFGQNIDRAVRRAMELRQQLREVPIRDIHDVAAMARLDAGARQALEMPELIADAFIGEVFASGNSGSNLNIAVASLAIQASQAIDGDMDAIKAISKRTRFTLSFELPGERAPRRPFHWALEYPEVFRREASGFDSFIGNPPFAFGKNVSTSLGATYSTYLVAANPAATKNADLCAHFFYKAFQLLNEAGTQGMLATSSIAEGETRLAGLEAIISTSGSIYSATSKSKWPGAANVYICRVAISKKRWNGPFFLDAKLVSGISSFLTPDSNLQPQPLQANKGIAFYGAIPNGDGFFISRSEAEAIFLKSPDHRVVIYPFLTGKDLNSSPTQTATRYAINFWDWTEVDAAKYAAAYRIAAERVKPYRQSLLNTKPKLAQKWWIYEANPKGLHDAIGRSQHFRGGATRPVLERVLAIARVSSTNAFTFVPTNQVFDCALIIVASDDYGLFAVLQSSIHFVYAWQHGGKMKSDLRYSPTMCLATFPFPHSATLGELRSIGKSFNDSRQALLTKRSWGLTRLANSLNDQNCDDSDIHEIRSKFIDLNQRVLEAYGWHDIDLLHGFHHVDYLPEGRNLRYTISESARIEILRRLSDLNQRSYAAEAGEGLRGASTKGTAALAKNTNVATTLQRDVDFGDDFAREDAGIGLNPANAILESMRKHNGWLAKSAILNATGISDAQWNIAIGDLVSSGAVERQGERRGAKYRAVSAGGGND
jgi:hypothetical protein